MRPEKPNPQARYQVEAPERWTAVDDEAAELEVSGFLAGLVRVLKPRVIIETGAYQGQTTLAMAMSAAKNGFGKVHAAEVDEDMLDVLEENLGSNENVHIFRGKGEDMIKGMQLIDLAFIDGGDNNERMEQFALVKQHLAPFGVIAIHDSAQTRYEGMDTSGMREFHIYTPRGLTLYQKA